MPSPTFSPNEKTQQQRHHVFSEQFWGQGVSPCTAWEFLRIFEIFSKNIFVRGLKWAHFWVLSEKKFEKKSRQRLVIFWCLNVISHDFPFSNFDCILDPEYGSGTLKNLWVNNTHVWECWTIFFGKNLFFIRQLQVEQQNKISTLSAKSCRKITFSFIKLWYFQSTLMSSLGPTKWIWHSKFLCTCYHNI